jgi:hypothetical protein
VEVRLPAALLRQVERQCRATGESRSAFVSRALSDFCHPVSDRRAYEPADGHRAMPGTPEEIGATGTSAFGFLPDDPRE